MIQLKNDLESYLNENVTETAIKWANTQIYTLDGDTLDDDDVDALEVFIEPTILPIEAKRGIIGGSQPIKKEIFFHINIFVKKDLGTGAGILLVDQLDTLFREKIINLTTTVEVEAGSMYSDENWFIIPVSVLCFRWA